MINFRKGPALSLHQVNYVASPATTNPTAAQAIEAGHVVRIQADGLVYKGFAANITEAADGSAIYGFAINNQLAGDVIESGKIGVYALDGASVIETDKFTDAAGGTEGLGSANFVPGKYVSADVNGNLFIVADAGLGVTQVGGPASATTGQKIIGQVVSAPRTLPGKKTAISGGLQYQTDATVVCIKLAI
jgi:hypothetical protein